MVNTRHDPDARRLGSRNRLHRKMKVWVIDLLLFTQEIIQLASMSQ